MNNAARVALILVFGLTAIASSVGAGDEKWIDMSSCEMCKTLAAHKGLMDNMTVERHNIENGVVTVCTVREPYMKAYKEASKDMEAVGARLEKGEKVHLCKMCSSLNSMFTQGLKYEIVPTKHGSVTLMTSSDPDVIDEVQQWATRSNEEMKTLAKEKVEYKYEHAK